MISAHSALTSSVHLCGGGGGGGGGVRGWASDSDRGRCPRTGPCPARLVRQPTPRAPNTACGGRTRKVFGSRGKGVRGRGRRRGRGTLRIAFVTHGALFTVCALATTSDVLLHADVTSSVRADVTSKTVFR